MEKLAPTEQEMHALNSAAAGLAEWYYSSLAERPVFNATTSRALQEALREPLPREGTCFESLLDVVRNVVVPYSRHNAHPRFFGYVASPGTAVAAAGSMIEAALNVNVTAWRSAPSAVEMEHVTIDWLKEMLGYPAEAAGALVSGGSMANFAALAAARSAKAPDVVREGVNGRKMCVYVSEESHFSIGKAAAMLGMGQDNVRAVRTDDRLRMDPIDLERLIQADLAAGYLPVCASANMGTVASGAVDPIGELAAVAHRYGVWLHVDGAYGGFAALAPCCRSFFRDIAQADSVTLDPHKWLYLPMGCGCVLYKDPAAARAAFSHDAEYTRVIGLERDEAFAFWDYTPELSRPFRALNIWLLLKYAGARRLGEAIERNIACAKHAGKLIDASGDLELLAPVELSIFCFRYAPRGYAGDLDALNERILVNLQNSGRSYVSNAKIRGKFALRACVLNYRTTERDIELLLEDVRNAAK